MATVATGQFPRTRLAPVGFAASLAALEPDQKIQGVVHVRREDPADVLR